MDELQMILPATAMVAASLSAMPGPLVSVQQKSSDIVDVSNSCQTDAFVDLSQKSESLRALKQIQDLPKDWNGYGGAVISLNVIELARNIVMQLEYQPEIYPTGRGTIQMQYELSDKSYLEFEIYGDKIEVLKVPQRIYEKAEEFSITADKYYEINDVVKRFMYS